jgi:hypothetical protein
MLRVLALAHINPCPPGTGAVKGKFDLLCRVEFFFSKSFF